MAACKRHKAHLWECVLEPVASLQFQNQQYTQRTANKLLWKRKWKFSICGMSVTSARGLPKLSHGSMLISTWKRHFPAHVPSWKLSPLAPLAIRKFFINIQLYPVQMTFIPARIPFLLWEWTSKLPPKLWDLSSKLHTCTPRKTAFLNNEFILSSNITWKNVRWKDFPPCCII
jgi:hypothetical protein